MDNVLSQRLWRSLKYEEVYPQRLCQRRRGQGRIGAWIGFYNEERQPTGLFFLAVEGQDEGRGSAARRGARGGDRSRIRIWTGACLSSSLVQRPLPSMLMAISWRFKVAVNASLVNWLPWSQRP